MAQPVILVTHTQLSQEAKTLMSEGGAKVVYLTPPISEDTLIETIARMGTVAATQIMNYLARGELDKANLANPAVALPRR